MKSYSVVVAVFLFLSSTFIVAACSDDSPCDSLPSSIVFFPEQKSQKGVDDAQLGGELVISDRLLRVEMAGTAESYLLLWPPGYSVCKGKDGSIQVFSKGGHAVVEVGEEVYMNGGERNWPIESVNDLLVNPLPVSAEGPYWLVGDEVRPNIRHDSSIFDFDILSEEDQTLLFIRRKPLLDTWVSDGWWGPKAWVEEEATFPGEIRGSRYLYLSTSDDPPHRYLLLWPSEYEANITNGIVTINSDKVTVKVGKPVIIEGYAIPINFGFGFYPRLREDLPADCHGPYLVVSAILD